MLEKWPDCPGSLGLAISEAVEEAVTRDDTHYSIGSCLNHVLLHQTIIGEETRKQMEMADAYPDIIVGNIGGGSNYAGQFLPWIRDKISGERPDLRVICVEPESCPTMTKGIYAYDFGDAVGMAPIVKMHTLGHGFIPPPVHAGGLRYHGMAPIICHLHELGFVEAVAAHQIATFEAGVKFARTEGIITGPEPCHNVKVAIDEALKCKESGEAKTILIAHSGHGHFDLAAYDAYLSGKLKDYAYPEEEVKKAQAELPKV
jgi:tryptophan synthase beta chain